MLRQHLLESFDSFWIENMHGNRKISEYAPDGKTSETIFATPGFSVGIQQGVAVSLWTKSGKAGEERQVKFRDDLNAARAVDRRQQLVNSLADPQFQTHYQTSAPRRRNRFSFRPEDVSAGYDSWPALNSLSATPPMLGLNDNRGQATHAIGRTEIASRMRAYYDPAVSFEQIAALHPGLTTDAASFEARTTRARLQRESTFRDENVRRFWFKPFDLRWAYIERTGNLWNRVRPELLDQAWDGNEFLLGRRHAPKCPDGATFFYSRHISDQHALHTDAYFIPIRLRQATDSRKDRAQGALLTDSRAQAETVANLSPSARAYLASIGFSEPDGNATAARWIWSHALAIGYSPAYLFENADGIRQDWPRIPLPNSKGGLMLSAELGIQIAALLDTERTWDEVARLIPTLQIAPLHRIATFELAGKGPLDETQHLAVSAGWGHAGKEGVTMPGKGNIKERNYTPQEREAVADAARAQGISNEQAFEHLGARTCDVYLNDSAYWSNIPARVWEYTIGGYQVIKKWLSYREQKLLGRGLRKGEVREVQEMARRIAAILLFEPALDANYQNVKEHATAL